jgi:dimethylhistidine N-methyltransferase
MYELNVVSFPSRRRRVVFHDLQPSADNVRDAVIRGLSRPEKALPCRLLYDARGSMLFDRICTLPEYYPTRTETAILQENADDIARLIGPDAQLVELGSGSSTKVRIILDALETPYAYVPIDISAQHLRGAAEAIQIAYPELRVEAVCADYTQEFELPPVRAGRRVGFYPGSTIGNLTPAEAQDFLALWAKRLGPGADFLIGVDLRKSAAILEPAYNDAQGVTAAFSLNILHRLNRELGANFHIGRFKHRARYLTDEGRVAIHLESLADQMVRIGPFSFHFAEGELVHIEDSWKYALDEFRQLAGRAGFSTIDRWVDDQHLFSVHLLKAEG